MFVSNLFLKCNLDWKDSTGTNARALHDTDVTLMALRLDPRALQE